MAQVRSQVTNQVIDQSLIAAVLGKLLHPKLPPMDQMDEVCLCEWEKALRCRKKRCKNEFVCDWVNETCSRKSFERLKRYYIGISLFIILFPD